MQPTLLIHILAGGLGLVAGAFALSAGKGGRLHRRSGMIFVWAMLGVGLSGAGMAIFLRQEGSIFGGFLSAYLVITALTTVRPSTPRWLHLGAMVLGVAIGAACIATAFQMIANRELARDGIPVPMFVIFSVVAVLAISGDLRVLRSGALRGTARLRRHLWRMCFAFFLGTGSFFLGQQDEFPDALRIPALLGILGVLPLLLMVYWMLRPGPRRSLSMEHR